MMTAMVPALATAQETRPREASGGWAQEKCERYTRAYADSVARLGVQGLGADFLERHRAFLASGCTSPANVCPGSEEELRLANTLVIRGMNAGMSSTFFPFSCRKAPAAEALSLDPRHKP
jgi:hypothetical protein